VTLPEIHVDIGFTASNDANVFTVGDPDLGQVGVIPIGDDTIWTDVTAYVRKWSIKRGATQGDAPTLRYDPGTCTIEFNDGDRRFDPDNLAGPYVSAGRSQVEANRRVRIRATYGGADFPLIYAFANDWTPSYQNNAWTYTTLTATDAFKLFAANDRGASVLQGAGENTGARISRILNAYGWVSPAPSIATGDTTLQATDLSGSMLAELQLAQDTEQGEFFIDNAGRPCFRNRTHILTWPYSATSQATFGDGGYAATGEIPYADVTLSTPSQTMVNTVSATRVGGTEQTVTDAVSINRYGPAAHSRQDLIMQDDTTALNWAYWTRNLYAEPGRRFDRLTFNTPRTDVEAVHWPAILRLELGQRITVIRRPAGGGDPIEHDCIIRGIEHDSDGAEWKVSYVLQDADRFAFFVVGDPILGRVDYNAVAY
jgi:hypothetical protein